MEILFSELKINGNNRVRDSELVCSSNNDQYRLYLCRDGFESGFKCLALEWVSCGGDFDGSNLWGARDCMVRQLFEVTAYFDGVRHLEFNREAEGMAGYIYYPSTKGIIELFEKVRELELKYCWDCEK